jgi:hypothetical protein
MPEGDDNGIKLSNEIKEKCRKSGIILESVSTEYPLLKEVYMWLIRNSEMCQSC